VERYQLLKYKSFYHFGEYCRSHGITKVNFILLRKRIRNLEIEKAIVIIERQAKEKGRVEEKEKIKITVTINELLQT